MWAYLQSLWRNWLQAVEFGKITQNNGHYFVQGHSRSPFLVPIKSSYATSYLWVILTYVLFCTVSKLLRIIGQFFWLWTGWYLFWYTRSGWSPKSCKVKNMEYGIKKLGASLCRTVQNTFGYLEPCRRGSRVWQTDRRTDKTAVSNSAVYQR